MSLISEAVAEVKAEIKSLEEEFNNAKQFFESFGTRVANLGAKVSSLHKQAVNEEQPNPETNATTPPS